MGNFPYIGLVVILLGCGHLSDHQLKSMYMMNTRGIRMLPYLTPGIVSNHSPSPAPIRTLL